MNSTFGVSLKRDDYQVAMCAIGYFYILSYFGMYGVFES